MGEAKHKHYSAAALVAEEMAFESEWQDGLRFQCGVKFATAKIVTGLTRDQNIQKVRDFIEFCGYIAPADVIGFMFGKGLLQRKPGMARVYPVI